MPPKASPFAFELNDNAARRNTELLRSFDFDLGKVIEAHPGTVSSYGSELRPLGQLRALLQHHPQWATIEQYARSGIDYPFVDDISEDDRVAMLHENIQRGNHRSALNPRDRVHVEKACPSPPKVSLK